MVTLCCLVTPGQGGRDQPADGPGERPSGTFLRKCGSGFSHRHPHPRPHPSCRFRLRLPLRLLLLLFLLRQREWSRAQWGAQQPQRRAADSDHHYPPAGGASDRGWEERAAAEKAVGEFRDFRRLQFPTASHLPPSPPPSRPLFLVLLLKRDGKTIYILCPRKILTYMYCIYVHLE